MNAKKLQLLTCAAMLGATSAAAARRQPATAPIAAPAESRVVVSTSAAAGSEQADRAQIAASAGNALDSLRADLETRSIDSSANLTIGEFLNRTDGREPFVKVLRRAEQIGGPRWIDDQTCQVSLEIEGARVVQALCDIAATSERTPIPADVLDRKLEDWKRRSFAATGSSIRADRATMVKAFGSEAWRNVDDRSRAAAVIAARENAVQHTLDAVRPVPIGADAARPSTGDVLAANEALSGAMAKWLADRPVTALRFADNAQVYYTLSAGGGELFDAFVDAAKHADVKLSDDPAVLKKARDEFRERVNRTVTVGRGAARKGVNKGAKAAPPTAMATADANVVAGLVIPDPPPDWIYRQIDASGTAPRGDSQLRTKQQAEDAAAESIRAKLLSMTFNPGETVGEAAKRNPQLDRAVSRAISRAISRARVYKVDYDPSGAVSVKMMIDPRDFWSDLNR